MPIKHQMDSYRNKAGVRYLNEGDVLEGDVRAEAKRQVQAFRAAGRKAFYEVHPDGYARVFVEANEGDDR